MNLVVFDIDGTLIESYDFDTECFQKAIQDVLGVLVDRNWGNYRHVTDAGILNQIMDEGPAVDDRESIILAIKERFIERIATYLSQQPIFPIPGADRFLAELAERGDVTLAMATGGWYESATLKLKAAGIDTTNIPIASASDHQSRIDIMKLAEARAGGVFYTSRTYFGDGPWDLKASAELGYNFVLVGNRTKHSQAIPDFTHVNEALAFIGLSQHAQPSIPATSFI